MCKLMKCFIKGIKSFLVRKSDIEISHSQLAVRHQIADTVKGTKSNYCFVSINEMQLLVYMVLDSITNIHGYFREQFHTIDTLE